jgi:hypothetical protein
VFVYKMHDVNSFAIVRDWVLDVKRSVKTLDKQLLLVSRGSGNLSREEIAFARQERMSIVKEELAADRGFEWKLWLFKLCHDK